MAPLTRYSNCVELLCAASLEVSAQHVLVRDLWDALTLEKRQVLPSRRRRRRRRRGRRDVIPRELLGRGLSHEMMIFCFSAGKVSEPKVTHTTRLFKGFILERA